MDNQELNNYKKYHELANDISKLVLENEESQNVNDYFANEENVRQMKQRMENAHEVAEVYREVEKRDKAGDISRLELKIKQKIGRRAKRRRLTRGVVSTSIAAAIMVISFLVYDGEREDVANIELTEQVEVPSVEGVKIIHSDGKEEILDTKKRIIINGVDVAQVDENRIEYNHGAIDSVEISTIVIPRANCYTVVLEDGTEIYLSANSTLKYPSKFVGESRDVELTGEAYFKVTKNSKPFNVKVLDMAVRVYGTEFSINSYNRKKVETTLLSGSVGVRYNKNNRPHEIKITPNQRLTVDSDNGNTMLDKNINREKCLSWRDGFFRSDEEPFRELLEDIGHWYGVEFVFESESASEKFVSASLDSKMPIESLIKMLELSTKTVIIKEEGGKYIVK